MLGYGCFRGARRHHGQAVHPLMRGMHCRVELINSTGNAPILTTVQHVLNTLHNLSFELRSFGFPRPRLRGIEYPLL